MAPVVCAVLLGSALGFALQLECRAAGAIRRLLKKLPLHQGEEFPMEQYITVIALFCASGFGIYAAFVEAMSGDSSILLAKAALDMMTAMIFAIHLRFAVAVVPVPMLASLLVMFCAGKGIAPLVTPEMLLNFTACGGILTLAAGLRVSGLRACPFWTWFPPWRWSCR